MSDRRRRLVLEEMYEWALIELDDAEQSGTLDELDIRDPDGLRAYIREQRELIALGEI